MLASLVARLCWQAACLVSGPDELSRAGIAAGFAVAGGAGHEHTRWPAQQPHILRRVGLCRWPGSSGRRAGSTVAKGSEDHHTCGPTGRIHRTTHRIVSATGAPGGANATVDRAGPRGCRLLTRPARDTGDPSSAGSWAAERRAFAGLAGSLRACRQRSCWSGSGSAPAGVVRHRRRPRWPPRGGAHRRGLGDDQHLQAADRRLLSLICRPCQALGNAAQRKYQAVPVDGAVARAAGAYRLQWLLKRGQAGILAPPQRYQ